MNYRTVETDHFLLLDEGVKSPFQISANQLEVIETEHILGYIGWSCNFCQSPPNE